ncbi:MAG: DUF2970 domain-containing protein [Burkholderiales bacterium]|jgi:hypothetical protein
MTDPGSDLREAIQRKASLGQTIKAVAWSFLGIRKSSDYEKDISQLNPVHVIVAGVLAAVLFVLGLLAVVNWVLSSGVA